MGSVHSSLLWEDLPGLFPGFAGAERWLPLLQQHHALLREAEARVRTTSVPAADSVRRLYAESLESLRIAMEHGAAGPVVDVGSGGGFPGLVIAAVLHEWPVALVESLEKRAKLLREFADAMNLANVTVYAERAEVAGRGPLRDSAGLVTAKAVAELRELLEYTAPFAAPGGMLALAKGSGAAVELEEAPAALTELGLIDVELVGMRPEVSATPWTLVARKTGKTPERYPRRPGIPAKRPL
jgi:16S rRNA (guanine527-N7)-methyltransferase